MAPTHDQPAARPLGRLPAPRETNRLVGGDSTGHGRHHFDAAIFDMDGVVTRTATVHSRAWKQMFDDYLRLRAEWGHEPFREFTHEGDYRRYVDGRPRFQGVAAFLESRGISLPPGTPDEAPGTETVWGLGNRKNAIFNEIVAREGAGLYESTVALIHELHTQAIKVGLATSSRNSAMILGKSGVAQLFGSVVDGIVAEQLGLAGKPAPDIFQAASARLGVPPGRAIVIEDAVTGVQAGADGGFALVIGLAREDNHAELQRAGADLVIGDLAETSLAAINAAIRAKRAKTA